MGFWVSQNWFHHTDQSRTLKFYIGDGHIYSSNGHYTGYRIEGDQIQGPVSGYSIRGGQVCGPSDRLPFEVQP